METQDTQDTTASSENDAQDTQQATETTESVDNQEQSAVPEKYELKVPEGYEQADVEKFSEAAKQLGLTNDQAQTLLEQQAQQKADFTEAAQNQFKAMTEQWVEDAKKDAEYGGENFERALQYAESALDKFATPEFKQALNESGYGSHPEMVRIFYRVGKSLSEDKPVGGEQNQGGEQDRAKIFYPNMN